MIERLIEQYGAVVLESTKASDRDLILTPNEITQLENVASVLRPLQEATTVLSSKKAISIFLVQAILAGIKKQFKPSDMNTVIAAHVTNLNVY